MMFPDLVNIINLLIQKLNLEKNLNLKIISVV